LAFNLLSYTFI